MKHWQETDAVFKRMLVRNAEGVSSALSVIVSIEGSSYRRAGAKLLVDERGETLGNVSGGCLEEALKEVARDVMASGEPQKVHYETGGDEESIWGFGLGCGGSIDLLVLPVRESIPGEVAERVVGLLAGETGFSLTYGINAQGRGYADLGQGSTEQDGPFTEVLEPPPRLLVIGAGEDVFPLIRQAADVGMRVTVVDHRSAYLKALPKGVDVVQARADDDLSGFVPGDNTYAVVKTHSYSADRDWVARLLDTSVPYVGLLGPKARCAKIADSLRGGVGERLYGPVGLDLGGEGPEQVAMSIIAEVLAVRSGRDPGHLRGRDRPIHD